MIQQVHIKFNDESKLIDLLKEISLSKKKVKDFETAL